MFEATFLTVGGLLGGPIGVGTVLVALCIGPSCRGRRTVSAGVVSQASSACLLGGGACSTEPLHTVRRVRRSTSSTARTSCSVIAASELRRSETPRAASTHVPRACSSTLQLLEEGATHVGVATDHVIESFRNDLWPGTRPARACARAARPDPAHGGRAPGAGRDGGRWSSGRPTMRSAPPPPWPRRRPGSSR